LSQSSLAIRVLFESVEQARASTPFFIFEEGMGIWLNTTNPHLLAQGQVISLARDAIHIPSLEKSGRPLPAPLAAEFLERAKALGLERVSRARGYWTLSETGELQAEEVLIAWSDTPVAQLRLLELARFILEKGNQDAVAWEEAGEVKHLYRD
jgi:hypothetical protein